MSTETRQASGALQRWPQGFAVRRLLPGARTLRGAAPSLCCAARLGAEISSRPKRSCGDITAFSTEVLPQIAQVIKPLAFSFA